MLLLSSLEARVLLQSSGRINAVHMLTPRAGTKEGE